MTGNPISKENLVSHILFLLLMVQEKSHVLPPKLEDLLHKIALQISPDVRPK